MNQEQLSYFTVRYPVFPLSETFYGNFLYCTSAVPPSQGLQEVHDLVQSMMKIITYVCEPNILQETCHGISPLSAGSPPTILPPMPLFRTFTGTLLGTVKNLQMNLVLNL